MRLTRDLPLLFQTVPGGKTFDLTGLASGTKVTLAGDVTFTAAEWEGPLFAIDGSGVTFDGAGHTFDGQGAKLWDGKVSLFSLLPTERRVDLTWNDLPPAGLERWKNQAQVPPGYELGHIQESYGQELAPTGTYRIPHTLTHTQLLTTCSSA